MSQSIPAPPVPNPKCPQHSSRGTSMPKCPRAAAPAPAAAPPPPTGVCAAAGRGERGRAVAHLPAGRGGPGGPGWSCRRGGAGAGLERGPGRGGGERPTPEPLRAAGCGRSPSAVPPPRCRTESSHGPALPVSLRTPGAARRRRMQQPTGQILGVHPRHGGDDRVGGAGAGDGSGGAPFRRPQAAAGSGGRQLPACSGKGPRGAGCPCKPAP